MKIQNITSYNQKNNIKNNIQNINNLNHSTSIKNDTIAFSSNISFGGISDIALSLQARFLERQSNKFYKEAMDDMRFSEEMKDMAIDIQRDSYQIRESSKYLINEVKSTLMYSKSKGYPNEHDRDDGHLIREFYDDALSRFVMEEYNKDEKTIRKVIVGAQTIQVIEYNPETKKNDLFVFSAHNDELLEYSAGYKPTVEDLTDEGSTDLFFDYKADMQYRYTNGRIASCDEKYSLKREKQETSLAHYDFYDYELCDAYIARVIYPNDTEKSTQHFYYQDGMLYRAVIDEAKNDNGIDSSSQEFMYSDDGLLTCSIGLTIDKENLVSSLDKMFKYGDYGLESVHLNVEADSKKRETKAEKLFSCVDGRIKRCAFDYKCVNSSRESFSKMVRVK